MSRIWVFCDHHQPDIAHSNSDAKCHIIFSSQWPFKIPFSFIFKVIAKGYNALPVVFMHNRMFEGESTVISKVIVTYSVLLQTIKYFTDI